MPETQSSLRWATNRAIEPELDIKDIQGNIIPGFNKDFQAFLFLKIEDAQYFRRWLRTLSFTTMEQVLDFVRSKKEAEQQKKPFKPTTWLNIAFSHSALLKLEVLKKDADFRDTAFRAGLWQRTRILSDPIDGREGDPRNWVVGGPNNEADVVLIVASDKQLDLYNKVARIEDSIYTYALPKTNQEMPNWSGVRIIFKQHSANLPESLAGHEHFGFRDGISQPGVRGRLSKKFSPAKDDYLTPCEDFLAEDEGKPGQKLVWPGEFVFGYPRQDPTNSKQEGTNSLNAVDDDDKIREFARNGSFLVIRRLRQDVGAFHKFLHDKAGPHAKQFGEMFVGRRLNGASIFSNPDEDSKDIVQVNPRINAFEFQKDDTDPDGKVCPFASHIRRTNPRDDRDTNETLTHRLLRRGIPYGNPSPSTFTEPKDDAVDRGLFFISYQTSIENQFEHIQKVANNPWFGEGEPGYDPIIGQNNRNLPRKFRFAYANGTEAVTLPQSGWVIPTGGGYFFAPSIKAIKDM